MFRFELPDIGEGVVEAEILAWKVAPGDWVEEDQVLVELLTDKAEIEIPSPRAGRVHRLGFQVGEVAPVGAVLIEIDDAAEGSAAAEPAAGPKPMPRPRETAPAPAGPARARPPSLPERPRSRQRASQRPSEDGIDAVPAVRELARRLSVDLGRVSGTGPGGRIMRRDVESFHASGGSEAPEPERARPSAPADDPPDWERQPLRGLRRAIARHMVHARRTAAHFTYVDEVDMTALLELRGREEHPVSPLAYVAHAAVRALRELPVLNASIDDEREEVILKGDIHLGMATATEEGLLVPVIRDAARLSVRELAEATEILAQKARDRRLEPAELRGSTFTISSLGKLGGIVSTPIVNHPEVAILGVNAIRPVLALQDGELRNRQVMNLSLSVDHRIADGLVAARFIQEVRRILERTDFPDLAKEDTP